MLNHFKKPTIALALGLLILLPSGCAPAAPDASTAAAPAATPEADLSGIKSFLLGQTEALTTHTAALLTAAETYAGLVDASGGDYAALWETQGALVKETLSAARTAWIAASPAYEKAEGVVAGTPSLAAFDVILDAGVSGAEDPANAAPIALTLADGRVFDRPGNLFGVAESTLWGTAADYSSAVAADLDGDGAIGFGDVLPDALVLAAAAKELDVQARALQTAAQSWQPNPQDAFTALVVMVPTMSEYFASWRDSRFVAGNSSTQRDFVVISRLADVQDILSGLIVVYGQVQPLAQSVHADQATMVDGGLSDLLEFVATIANAEAGGRRYSPEEADMLGAEAQNRATAITGQISQIAALLGIDVAN